MPLRWRRRTAKPRPADAMPADLVAWAQVVDASGLLSLGYEQYDMRLPGLRCARAFPTTWTLRRSASLTRRHISPVSGHLVSKFVSRTAF